jgi:threonine dehydrogenase-like Zn-dependent dehydrogenase
MKALVYTGPRRLELQDLPVPRIAPHEALVRIRAVGVCGSDLFGYLGRSKRRVPPLILGHEFAGEVVEVGAACNGFRAGQAVAVYPLVTCGRCRHCQDNRHHICPDRRVYSLDFHGAMAEFVSVPHECLFRIPSGMSYLEGALVEPLANAIHVVEKCGPLVGAGGVIFGAGSIGLLIYWYARHLGADRLAVVDRNPHRIEVVKRMGADLVIDASKIDPVERVRIWTGGRGAEFTVDAVGVSLCRQQAIACSSMGSISVWIGLEDDQTELSCLPIVNREIDIRGSYAYSRQDFAKAITLLEQKLLPTDDFVTQVDLTQGREIFEQLIAPNCSMIKAVFMQ